MNDYITEVRLSRALAKEVKTYLDWCASKHVGIEHMFPELVKKFDDLNKHYIDEIERGVP